MVGGGLITGVLTILGKYGLLTWPAGVACITELCGATPLPTTNIGLLSILHVGFGAEVEPLGTMLLLFSTAGHGLADAGTLKVFTKGLCFEVVRVVVEAIVQVVRGNTVFGFFLSREECKVPDESREEDELTTPCCGDEQEGGGLGLAMVRGV